MATARCGTQGGQASAPTFQSGVGHVTWPHHVVPLKFPVCHHSVCRPELSEALLHGQQRGALQRCSVSALERLRASIWRDQGPPAQTSGEDVPRPPAPEPPECQEHTVLQPAAESISTPPLSTDDVDGKEKERRARISAANTGKTPWNKGRRHSAETIAKIRERTKAAMSRPEVVNAYKQGVAKHLEKRAEERKHSPSSPPQPRTPNQDQTTTEGGATVRRKAVSRRPTPASELDTLGLCSTIFTEAAEGWHRVTAEAKAKLLVKNTTSVQQPKHGQAGASGERRSRAPSTEEHKAAIAAAIRAKWQDPEYRQRAVAAMQEQRLAKAHARGVDMTKPRRNRSSSSSSSTGGRSMEGVAGQKARAMGAVTAAQQRKTREEHLAQIEALVSKVLSTQMLIARMDMNLEGMKHKASAFQHDPRMASKATTQIHAAEQTLTVARAKLAQMQMQIPRGVRYNSQGHVSITDPRVLDLPLAAAQSDTSSSGTSGNDSQAMSGMREGGREGLTVNVTLQEQEKGLAKVVVQATSLLSYLDPEAMRDPLHAVPHGMGDHATPHANGHSHHANGHGRANGHSHGHANGHGHANNHTMPYTNGHASHGVSHDESRILDPVSASSLLAHHPPPPPTTHTLLPQGGPHEGTVTLDSLDAAQPQNDAEQHQNSSLQQQPEHAAHAQPAGMVNGHAGGGSSQVPGASSPSTAGGGAGGEVVASQGSRSGAGRGLQKRQGVATRGRESTGTRLLEVGAGEGAGGVSEGDLVKSTRTRSVRKR